MPAAEGTVEESAEDPDAPTATAVGESLNNPVPVGQAGEVGKWSVEVIGFTENANRTVARENMFNEKPKDGSQYVLATLRTTYNGRSSADPFFDLEWAVISEDGTLFESPGQVLPKDLSNVGNVPSGVSGEGNVDFLVKSSAAGSLVLYLENWGGNGGFFALK